MRRIHVSPILLAMFIPLWVSAFAADGLTQREGQSAQTVSNAINSSNVGRLSDGQRPAQARAMLLRFYAHYGNLPVWGGGNRPLAMQLLRQLDDANQYGLDRIDYAVPPPPSYDAEQTSEELARFDVDLTIAALRFLSDLHFGRTPPDFAWYAGSREPDAFDAVERLRSALDQRTLDSLLAAVEPGNALYSRVKQTLTQYRNLEQRYADLAPLPPLPSPGKLEAGRPYAGASELLKRLVILGDMPDTAPADTDGVYNAALEAGVRAFQMRHGLEPDGILGKATMSELAVPLSQRIRQLELTLERLRWMPALPPGPLIVINIPSFRLWALDTSVTPSRIEAETRVIVGSTVRTPTPLFIAQLRHLEFNPVWNVPRSIALNELIRKLARDPGLLAREDYELVPTQSTANTSLASPLEALRAGALRIRQRPGARNVLGPVKFSMPNPHNIYLHATTAGGLFSRARRDLSHGCIRLEHPEELAVFALKNEEGWGRARIAAAMAPGPTRTVTLDTPIPVVLLYATALVDRQGRAIFLPDIYALDQKLAQAIAAGRPTTGAGIAR